MKKLLFLLLIVFSCTKIPEYTPPVYPKDNAVFWSSYGQYQVTGIINRTIRSSEKPGCDSYSNVESKYFVTYLKGGTYIVFVQTNHGIVSRNVVIHENYCNIFDCANIYGWEGNN